MKKIWAFVAIAIVGCLAPIDANVYAEVNWRQCEGTEIRLLMNRHPFSSYLQTTLPEFEALTGIRVVLEIFPEDQFRNKRLIELNAGGRVDGYMLMPGQVKLFYWKAGWLQPLDEYMTNPELTEADWDALDFFPGPMQGASIGERRIAVVVNAEASLLAYRKDLFERFAIKVPESMEELEAAAGFFHGREIDGKEIVGITLRGKAAAATSQWSDFLYSFGGSWLSEDGSSAIDSPESIAALKFYGSLLRNYGPRGAAMYHWPESTSLFMEGRAAMIFDANVFKSLYENPDESKVAGKVGYTMVPAGPAGRKPHVSNWSLAMSGTSPPERQKATWLFIQWATKKENAVGALMRGVPAGRISAWNTQEYRMQDTHQDWTEATLRSFEIGQPQWNPPVVNVPEIRDIVGLLIVDAIDGGDVETLAAKAARLMNRKMDRDYSE